jgi:cell division protein FtsW (lipid II flippase)
MKNYKATLDTLSLSITVGFIAVSLLLIYFSGAHWSIYIFLGAMVLLLLAIRPVRYELHPDHLLIKRLAGNKRISFKNIAEVKLLEKGEIKVTNTIRTFGSGGVFGYFGKHYNKSYGHIHFYMTRWENMVLITTKEGKKFLLSPNDTQLAEQLRERVAEEF